MSPFSQQKKYTTVPPLSVLSDTTVTGGGGRNLGSTLREEGYHNLVSFHGDSTVPPPGGRRVASVIGQQQHPTTRLYVSGHSSISKQQHPQDTRHQQQRLTAPSLSAGSMWLQVAITPRAQPPLLLGPSGRKPVVTLSVQHTTPNDGYGPRAIPPHKGDAPLNTEPHADTAHHHTHTHTTPCAHTMNR